MTALTIDSADELHYSVRQDRKEHAPWSQLVHRRIRDFDAIVIGAGFGGIYALHKLRNEQALTVAFEKGGGIGGTWYWNRYPGAKSDTEGFVYRYSFDKECSRTATGRRATSSRRTSSPTSTTWWTASTCGATSS